MAYAFKRLLPSRTPIVNLQTENDVIGEIHLIGFEFAGTRLDAVPYVIQDFLETLDSKEILLFATCPVQPTDQIKERIENTILPLLPSDCEYRGFFLCRGEASETLLNSLEQMTERQPGNKNARAWLSQCRSSKGHPNREDIRRGYRFISDALELDI